MNAVRTDHKVLVVSSDSMSAALVGAVVEGAWLQPAFVNAHESLDDSLARVKPVVGMLIDSASSDAGSDILVARAQLREVRVALFCRSTQRGLHAEWAAHRRLPVFALPDETGLLERWLLALGPQVRSKRSVADRRAEPTATMLPNGQLVLTDEAGMRWSVYDRRGGDRRGSGAIERHFVNELGEDRTCRISSEEEAQRTAQALVEQLARAT